MLTYNYVGFGILTAVAMQSSVFWDITPCNPLKLNRRFGITYHLDFQTRLPTSC
jgi:hypothetical protein